METRDHPQPCVRGKGRNAPLVSRRTAIATVALLAVLLAGLTLAPAAGAYVSGRQLWVRTAGSSLRPASCEAMAVGSDGAVYLAGARYRVGGGVLLLTKYNAAGKRLWTATWDGPGAADSGDAVAIAPSGNVYVAGTDRDSAYSYDIILLKYSPAGKKLWARRYDGPAGLDDWARALVVDGSDNAYIAGTSQTTVAGLRGAVALKYSRKGQLRWASRTDPNANDPQSGATFADDIALDGARNVYLCATSAYAGYNGAFVVKFAGGDGKELGRSGGLVILGTWTVGQALAIRGSEVVMVGSYHAWDEPDPAVQQLLVDRFDLTLASEWGVSATGTAPGLDTCTDVAIDGAGNVYAAGYTFQQVGASKRARATLLKVMPDGTIAWQRTYVPGTKTQSWAEYVAVAGGAAYLSGYSSGDTEQDDFLTVKYSAAGVRKWVRQWKGTGHGQDHPNSVGLGRACVYVGGVGRARGDFRQMVLIKYAR